MSAGQHAKNSLTPYLYRPHTGPSSRTSYVTSIMARPSDPVEFDIIEEFVTLDTSVTFDTIAVLVVAEGTNFYFKSYKFLKRVIF